MVGIRESSEAVDALFLKKEFNDYGVNVEIAPAFEPNHPRIIEFFKNCLNVGLHPPRDIGDEEVIVKRRQHAAVFQCKQTSNPTSFLFLLFVYASLQELSSFVFESTL